MKTHTSTYKTNIKEFGRQIDSIITYSIDGVQYTITSENLYSVTPSFEGNILKSVMKQLEVETDTNIPLNTIINYQFGVYNGTTYEYVDFGNYIVYQSEKSEDEETYKLTCYDKMLYSMKDYEELNVTYPITVRDLLSQICLVMNIEFQDASTNFANYNKQITKDLYKDLGYTYRDILDELAEVTASTICINSSDKLEIRYINNTNDTIDEEYLKDINVNFGEKYGPINSIVLSRSAESDNVYLRDETSVTTNGLCEVKIIDNQIMNFDDRNTYLTDILSKLNGLEYYLNDFSSTGITYYDLCDKYSISIGDNTYTCIMFNDEIDITQGLEEQVFTERPEETTTDYTKSDKASTKVAKLKLIVDQQEQTITGLVSTTEDLSDKYTEVKQTADSLTTTVQDIQTNGIEKVSNTMVTIDINGISVSTNTSAIKTTMTNNEFKVVDNGGIKLAYFGYDEDTKQSVGEMDNLTINTYLTAGVHRIEKFTRDNEERTGWFYVGGN